MAIWTKQAGRPFPCRFTSRNPLGTGRDDNSELGELPAGHQVGIRRRHRRRPGCRSRQAHRVSGCARFSAISATHRLLCERTHGCRDCAKIRRPRARNVNYIAASSAIVRKALRFHVILRGNVALTHVTKPLMFYLVCRTAPKDPPHRRVFCFQRAGLALLQLCHGNAHALHVHCLCGGFSRAGGNRERSKCYAYAVHMLGICWKFTRLCANVCQRLHPQNSADVQTLANACKR